LVLGFATHDLAIQGLTEDRPLRPFTGTCPRCGYERGWTRLRCPQCGRPIQREPVIALTGALTAAGFANTFGLSWLLIPYAGFLLLTLSLVVTDLEEFRIVDRLNIRGSIAVGAILAVTALATGEYAALGRALLGSAAYFAGATVLWLIVRGRGFGAGDVKLAPILGLFTAFISWGTLGQAVFATAMIGGVVALVMLAFGAAKMKTELPYGPPMVLGAWLAIVMAGIGSLPFPS
jgi:leader peptidase (prepilin peptidase)/N-methyltransferase